ncbi:MULTISPECIES: DsrE family protein [Haloferax]|uniref:Uncharacterized protein n=2 Tax=Haloferax TaxID=2251 RepID=A0A6G1Z3L5_9EURY|nr:MULTISPECIES: DsrE family protein [Haloferax]KAB1188213.1 hypothetical protein Hfx1149_09285 [Haloferax sp. CBA1149]MRW80894.1 hypothetical protein [Haloferax marinisediminis]
MNAVFHVTSGTVDEVRHAISNVENLLADDTVDTESVTLLANGDAVYFLLDSSPLAPRVESLVADGVRCRVCSNSLDGRDLDVDAFVDGVEAVPSGVGELVKRQSAGDAYLKVP